MDAVALLHSGLLNAPAASRSGTGLAQRPSLHSCRRREGLTRTNATDGIVMVTFTPLKGMSDVVRLFLSDAEMKGLG